MRRAEDEKEKMNNFVFSFLCVSAFNPRHRKQR